MPKSTTSTATRKTGGRRRRLLALMVLFVATIVTSLVFLPQILNLGAVKSIVLRQVNQIYAPTTIELQSIHASWTHPTRLGGLVLKDPDGKAVVSSPTATLDRSLWELLTDRPDYGTLTLHGATVDIERRPDGSIDLWEALTPLLEGDEEEEEEDGPETLFTLAVDQGTLRLTSPELAEPITAERLDMILHCSPAPLAWEIDLANPGGMTLSVQGEYTFDEATGTKALVAIAGENWPLSIAQADLVANTSFNGAIGVIYTDDSVTLTGETVMDQVGVRGPALSGDTPQFEQITANWDLDWGSSGLGIRTLEVKGPGIQIGQRPEPLPDGSTEWTGQLDLGTLAGLFPNSLKLRDGMSLSRGQAEFRTKISPVDPDRNRRVTATGQLSGLAGNLNGRLVSLGEPITVRARILQGSETGMTLESGSLNSSFMKAEGSGDLDQGIQIKGRLNLGQLDQQLHQWLDLGEFHVGGGSQFVGNYRRIRDEGRYESVFALEGRQIRILGLTEEPIEAESARIDFVAAGRASSLGIPSGWDRVHLETKGTPIVANLDLKPTEDIDRLAIEGEVALLQSDSEQPSDWAEALRVQLTGAYGSSSDRLDLDSAVLKHSYGTLNASGTIKDLKTNRVARLEGVFDPDWEELNKILVEAGDPQASLRGHPRTFRLQGKLVGGSLSEILKEIDAEVGVDLDEVIFLGLHLGPTPLIVRALHGDLQISPIVTTLNNGQVDLRPDVVVTEEGAVIVAVAPGSGVTGVEINNEVSKEVLAYVAPVLREAAEVRGRVSATLERTVIPAYQPATQPATNGPKTPIELAAAVEFDEVTYGPGPLMQNVIAMTGIPPSNAPRLKIDQVVNIAVQNDRVYQSGLEIDVAEGVVIELRGSVGLDQTLALNAGVPLSNRMLGGQQIVADLIGGQRVGLPIGGSLNRPTIDRAAFQLGMRQQSGQLLNRAAGVGADQLMRLLDGDQTPPADEAGESSDLGTLNNIGRGLLRGLLDEPRNRRP